MKGYETVNRSFLLNIKQIYKRRWPALDRNLPRNGITKEDIHLPVRISEWKETIIFIILKSTFVKLF